MGKPLGPRHSCRTYQNQDEFNGDGEGEVQREQEKCRCNAVNIAPSLLYFITGAGEVAEIKGPA